MLKGPNGVVIIFAAEGVPTINDAPAVSSSDATIDAANIVGDTAETVSFDAVVNAVIDAVVIVNAARVVSLVAAANAGGDSIVVGVIEAAIFADVIASAPSDGSDAIKIASFLHIVEASTVADAISSPRPTCANSLLTVVLLNSDEHEADLIAAFVTANDVSSVLLFFFFLFSVNILILVPEPP